MISTQLNAFQPSPSTLLNESHQRISTQFSAEKFIAETILPNRSFLSFNRRLSFTGIRAKCSKLDVDEFKIHQRQPAGETKSFRRRATIPQPPRIVRGLHPRTAPTAQDMAGNRRVAPR